MYLQLFPVNLRACIQFHFPLIFVLQHVFDMIFVSEATSAQNILNVLVHFKTIILKNNFLLLFKFLISHMVAKRRNLLNIISRTVWRRKYFQNSSISILSRSVYFWSHNYISRLGHNLLIFWVKIKVCKQCFYFLSSRNIYTVSLGPWLDETLSCFGDILNRTLFKGGVFVFARVKFDFSLGFHTLILIQCHISIIFMLSF